MGKFKIGDRVRFVDEEGHKTHPNYYPAVGTIGKIKGVIGVSDKYYWVQWPKGTTSGDNCWCCGQHRLELVTEGCDQDA